MVSLNECIGMSGLSEDELHVVATHEHVPAMVATGLASALLQTQKGIYCLHTMFRNVIADAIERNDRNQEHRVSQVYQGFRVRYPVPSVI